MGIRPTDGDVAVMAAGEGGMGERGMSIRMGEGLRGNERGDAGRIESCSGSTRLGSSPSLASSS